MPDDLQKLQETQIPTNLRLLLVVEEIAKAGTPLKPMQLSAALGLPKPTIHRLLQTAEAEGFLQRDLDGRSYGPRPATSPDCRAYDVIGAFCAQGDWRS